MEKNLFKFIALTWKGLGIFSDVLLVLIIAGLAVFFFMNRYLFNIAVRNIFRNTRRSIITILAIAIGNIGIIIFGGFISYTYYGLRESTIHSQLGHFQIYKKGYSEYGMVDPMKYKLYNFKEIKQTIMNDEVLKPLVEGVLLEVNFSGLVTAGTNSSSFLGRGVDPDVDRLLSSFDQLKSGNKLVSGDSEVVTTGYLLKKALGANDGDDLTILTQTNKFGLNVIDVKLKGTTESMSSDYDKMLLKMPINDAWRLMGEEYVDKMIVILHNTDDLPKVLNRFDTLSNKNNFDVEYKTWYDLATFYKSVISLYNGFFGFIKWIICVIIIVFITNTLYMAVMERVTEIGTLRTIGTKKIMVIQNFVIESTIMGIIGGLLGIISSVILAQIINIFGIPQSPPPGSNVGYNAYIRLMDKDSIGFIYFSFKLSILVSFFASFLPSKEAIDMEIVESLRHY